MSNDAFRDLTPLMKDIEQLFSVYFQDEKTAIALAFTLERDFSEVHYITNVSREDGIIIFRETANKMKNQIN